MKNKLKKFINKKNLIIIGIIFIILVCIVIFIINKKNNNSSVIKAAKYIDNININKLSLIESKKPILSGKYDLDKDTIVNETKGVVKLGEMNGKMLFIRGKEFNANVFESSYPSELMLDDIPKLVQIDQYMTSFLNGVAEELGIDDGKLTEETLLGTSNYDFNLPIEEAIYKDKRIYNKTYNIDDKIYDLLFYMHDDDFICELVRIFNN